MTDKMRANIEKLSDSQLTLADPAEDIRGRTVLDNAKNEIGDVEELMIDDDEGKVRFLQVGAGGFLGLGEKKFLVPVDAITDIDAKQVHVDQSRDRITGGPEYDPSMVREEDYWTGAYGYYGYTPFWTAGYGYPAFPYYGGVRAPIGGERRDY